MNMVVSCTLLPFFLSAILCAADDTPATPANAGAPSESPAAPSAEASPFALADQVVIDNQTIALNEATLTYDVRAGALAVRGKEEKDAANISYIAYFARESDSTPAQRRPIAFCFNGGPGSSSIWLHMGFVGPKTIDLQVHPAGYKDNPETLLSVCDLVFIDPVSTGFSTSANKSNPKKFHGVEEDLWSIADFIRLFLTKYHRWEHPKLLIGESYGTLRAVGLAHLLQDHYFIDIDGLVLISMVLDLQLLEGSPSIDVPCLTVLPTLASIAHFHKQLSPPLAQLPVHTIVEQAKQFALDEYGPALLNGSSLPDERRDYIAQRLSELTSLPRSAISKMDLRVSYDRFCEAFLKSQSKTIGRYDARMTAYRIPEEPSACRDLMSFPDPSFYAFSSAFTSALQAYLLNELHWQKAEPYIVISDMVHPWNWTIDMRPPAGCGYLSFMQDLRVAMVKNPDLKIFVAAGYYDLATPYFSQEYSLSHLLLPSEFQKNITFKGYEAGHMIYLDPPSRIALFKDLTEFVSGTTD